MSKFSFKEINCPICNKNNLELLDIKIWSPPKPNFKITTKIFLLFFMVYIINIYGNLFNLSQNMFIYAKNKRR